MNKIIEIKKVTKVRNNISLIRDISLSVEKNSVHLLLGKNGSGKTTLIKCLLGALNYSGEILIKNKSNMKIDNKKAFSFIPDTFSFPEKTSVFAFLKDMALLDGNDKNKAESIVENLVSNFNLSHLKDKKLGQLSLGERKRVLLVQSLTNNPELIIIDEPFNGLDVESRIHLLKQIKIMKDEGKSFFITTHSIDMFSGLADYVSIIKDGELIFSGSTENDLVEQYKRYSGGGSDE